VPHTTDYISLIEHQYFGNMALARPAQILALLTPDAQLTAFHGDDAPRIVRHHPRPGEESFDHFLSALHADFTLHYSQFMHVVDVDTQRAACTFRLEIRSRVPSPAVGPRVLRNCNFFQFRNGLICAVTAYFSLPPRGCDPWPRADEIDSGNAIS
jgi:ketosteroid isomerase-like protein